MALSQHIYYLETIMDTTNLWPEQAALGLPKHVYQKLISHITTPFDSLAEAKSFWQASSCQCIHLQPNNPITLTKQQLLCLSEPDFTEHLGGYVLFCRITNDFGGGLFILLPKGEIHDTHR